jgi:hypothetical protein
MFTCRDKVLSTTIKVVNWKSQKVIEIPSGIELMVKTHFTLSTSWQHGFVSLKAYIARLPKVRSIYTDSRALLILVMLCNALGILSIFKIIVI